MRARVFVTLKPSVFDPQGRTIADALHSLGYRTSRTCGRASTSSSIWRRPRRRRPSAGRRSRRQAAREPGDRELPHRGGLNHEIRHRRLSRQQLRRGRVSRREGRARPGGRVPLAQGHRPQGRRRRDPAGRVRARRLPAHRRDGALLADHGRRCGRSPSAAGRCSASATASRSCSKPGCCRARCCATGG